MNFGFDPITLVKTLGYFGLFLIIFAESGLFFGFFLPGDSLLFSAGLLASQGFFNPLFLVFLLSLGAIFGDSVGFLFGKKVGPAIFNKEESMFFHKRHIERARKFYEKYGVRTIILARFVPIVRTFAPILAGVGRMDYKKFLLYNLIGGISWTVLLLGAGYFLADLIPNINHYITYIVLIIIVVSFTPIVFEIGKKST